MANSTSHKYPIKNCRYSLNLGFRVSAGTPTDPTTPDTEYSIDGGVTYTDCAEEIATGGANGTGYLTLTGAEMNNTTLHIAGKSANCLTSPFILPTWDLALIGSGTLSAGSAGGGTLGTLLAYDVTGCFIRSSGGTGGGGTGGANNQGRKIATYNTSTGAFTVVPNWETTPDATTTYDVLLPEGVTLGMLKSLNSTTPIQTPGDLYAYLTTNLGALGANLSALPKNGFKLASDGLASVTAWTVAITGNITGSVSSVVGAVGSVTGAVGSVTAGVTLAASAVQAIWDALTSALTTSGSIGKKLADWSLGSDNRVKVSADAHTSGETVAAVAGNLGGNVSGNVNGNVVGSVGSVSGAVGSVTGAVGSVTGSVGGSVSGDVGGKVLGGGAGTITGNGVQASSVSGSVGSVSGAVGSVTGAVGSVAGNVAGDVAGKVLGGGSSSISGAGVRADSVTGAVGSVTGAVGSVTAKVDLVDAPNATAVTAIFAGVLRSALTEDYAADGTPPTLEQAIFLIQQSLHEFSITGTTRTVKKLDGTTQAAAFTLDSSTAPTSTTRSA